LGNGDVALEVCNAPRAIPEGSRSPSCSTALVWRTRRESRDGPNQRGKKVYGYSRERLREEPMELI
jgi:hypothetical protein